MTTKKEILNWIEDKKATYPNSKGVYEAGYFDALDIIKDKLQQLPDDSWIAFADQMPTEEDYRTSLIVWGNSGHARVGSETLNPFNYTHWKRITLPTKSLPTKAEILEKVGLSEDELKKILK